VTIRRTLYKNFRVLDFTPPRPDYRGRSGFAVDPDDGKLHEEHA
jgi:hypothetical protein